MVISAVSLIKHNWAEQEEICKFDHIIILNSIYSQEFDALNNNYRS
jgi:hypothetical protein